MCKSGIKRAMTLTDRIRVYISDNYTIKIMNTLNFLRLKSYTIKSMLLECITVDPVYS